MSVIKPAKKEQEKYLLIGTEQASLRKSLLLIKS